MLGEVGAHQVAHLGVAAVEERAQGGDVDLGLAVALVGRVDRVVVRRARRRARGRGVGISSAIGGTCSVALD